MKKNPKQLFSLLGAFNPTVRHREQRTMRRHLVLFDFLLRAVRSPEAWARLDPTERKRRGREALFEWYPALAGVAKASG